MQISRSPPQLLVRNAGRSNLFTKVAVVSADPGMKTVGTRETQISDTRGSTATLFATVRAQFF